MPQIISIIVFISISLFSYLFSISTFYYFAPQLLALISIATIILYFSKKSISIYLIALLINIVVFSTNGLNSPFFFLIYFFLFLLAFQNPVSSTLTYSLFLVLILSQSLNSFESMISLASLLLVTPLTWFIGKQIIEKNKNEEIIASDEISVLLWHSLKLKTGLCQIIDSCSELLSSPLSSFQKSNANKIKDSAKYLLNSSEQLTKKIDQESDE
jgi:hypothetical protein